MNYKESAVILEEIKKSKNILLNCHKGADPDSIASASSLADILSDMGKSAMVGSPEKIASSYDFLLPKNGINVFDFNSDLSEFDLLIILDSEHWGRISRTEKPKGIRVINIDHHVHNSIGGDINLVDPFASATCEVISLISSDWNIKLDKELSSKLLSGIYSDTGFFQYASTTARSCRIAAELLDKGADFNNIILNLKRRTNLKIIKMWGEIASRAEVDEKYKFSWSAIPYEIYKKYEVPGISPTSEAVDYFLRVIDGVNFALCMVEKTKNSLHLSLRGRVTGFDVSGIARELNGGGHKDASGGSVEGLPFEKAVEKALKVARKYAKS